FPRARRVRGQRVVDQDRRRPKVGDRPLRERERAVVGLLGVTDGEIEVLRMAEPRDRSREAALVEPLPVAAIERDRVRCTRLLVPARPVALWVAVVVARSDRQRLALVVHYEAVLVPVAVVIRAVGTRLEVDRRALRIGEAAVHGDPPDRWKERR